MSKKQNTHRPLTVVEAAEFLGIGASQVCKLICNGQLPATKFGQRAYLITEADLAEFQSRRRPVGRPKA